MGDTGDRLEQVRKQEEELRTPITPVPQGGVPPGGVPREEFSAEEETALGPLHAVLDDLRHEEPERPGLTEWSSIVRLVKEQLQRKDLTHEEKARLVRDLALARGTGMTMLQRIAVLAGAGLAVLAAFWAILT